MSHFYTYIYSVYVSGSYKFYIGSRTKYGITDIQADHYFGSPSDEAVKELLWSRGTKRIIASFKYRQDDREDYARARNEALRLERLLHERQHIVGKNTRLYWNKAIATIVSEQPRFGDKNHRYKGIIKAEHGKTGEVIVLHGKQSILDAGFDDSTVYKCLQGKRRQHKGYTFSRV